MTPFTPQLKGNPVHESETPLMLGGYAAMYEKLKVYCAHNAGMVKSKPNSLTAPIAQWIERCPPEAKTHVRVAVGASLLFP